MDNRGDQQGKPSQWTENKLELAVRHGRSHAGQRANAHDNIKASGPDGATKGDFSHQVHLGTVFLRINKELLEIGFVEEHNAPNDMNDHEPKRKQANVLANRETDTKPLRLGAESVTVPHVVEMSQYSCFVRVSDVRIV